MVKARPSRMSNLAPCRGQAIVWSTNSPSPNGPSSCVQTSLSANSSPPTLNNTINRSSSSTTCRPGSGISDSLATRTKSDMLIILANPPPDRLAQRLAHAVDRDPVKNLLEEPGDDHSHGLFPRQPA